MLTPPPILTHLKHHHFVDWGIRRYRLGLTLDGGTLGASASGLRSRRRLSLWLDLGHLYKWKDEC